MKNGNANLPEVEKIVNYSYVVIVHIILCIVRSI